MSDMYEKKSKQPFGVVGEQRANGTIRIATLNLDPTMTQQQYKEECDVNHIMKKYITTGEIHHINRKQGVYADMSEISDYQGMLDTVLDAQSKFQTLPADVREKFKNDPAKLIEFIQDPKNYDEGVKLGLFEPKKQTATDNNANDLNDIKKPEQKIKTPKQPKTQPDEE